MQPDLVALATRELEAELAGIATESDTRRLLRCWGDALRLAVEVPRGLRARLHAIDEAAVRAVLDASIRGTTRTVDAAELAAIVRERDEIDSILRAIQRLCGPAGLDPDRLPEHAALETILILRDHELATVASRAAVVRALGSRAAMGPTWADSFRAEDAGEGGEADWPPALLRTPPPDEIVARYVTRGALSRHVEGVAAENAAFAAELAECIDGLLAAGEYVGLLARRWRKRAAGPHGADPLRFAIVPALRLAAASRGAQPTASAAIRLGALAPVDAEGRLEARADSVILQVFPGETPLARIELGDASATAPTAEGRWEVSVARPRGVVRLRVVAAGGAEFAEEIDLAPAEST